LSENENALVQYDEQSSALVGMGFGDEPMKPTRLSLIQPIEAGDDPTLIAGRFRDSQSNMQFQNLNVVVLEVRDGRVLFPPGEGRTKGAKPLCRSNDGKFPIIGDDLVRQDGGKGCAKCDQGRWVKIGGKNIKPPCQETKSVLLAQIETGFLYRYSAKGTAVPPARDLRETIRKNHLLAKARKVWLPPYAMTFNLASTKLQGSKGPYYIPKFTFTGEVPIEDRPQFRYVYDYFVLGKGRNQAEDEDPVSEVLEGEYVPPQHYEAA
jgi:hypothetical protein